MSWRMLAGWQQRQWSVTYGAVSILYLAGILFISAADSQPPYQSKEIDGRRDQFRQPSVAVNEWFSLPFLKRRQLGQDVADVATPAELLGALRNPGIRVIRLTSSSISLNSSEWINMTQRIVLSRSVLLLGGGRYGYNESSVVVNSGGLYVILDFSGLVDRLQIVGPGNSTAVNDSLTTVVQSSLQLQGLWLRNHLPPTGYSPLILTSPSGGGSIRYVDCVLERDVGLQIYATAKQAALLPPGTGQQPQAVDVTAGPWCPPASQGTLIAAPGTSTPASIPLPFPRCLNTALTYSQFSVEVYLRCSPLGSNGDSTSCISTSSSSQRQQPAENSSSIPSPPTSMPISVIAPLLVVLTNCTYGVQHEVSPECVATFGADACIYQLQVQLFGPATAGPSETPAASGQGDKRGLSPTASAGVAVVVTLCFCLAVGLLVRFVRRLRDGHRTLTLAVRPPGATPLTTLLVTDIQNSTNLWEQLPTSIMNEAIRLHHRCLRGLLLKCNGYESATEGDSFILAFHGPMDAARFAILAQSALLELPWPQQLLAHEDGREVWAEPSRPKMVMGPAGRSGGGGHHAHSKSLGLGLTSLMLSQPSVSGPTIISPGSGGPDDTSDDGDVNPAAAMASATARGERQSSGGQASLLYSWLSAPHVGLLSRSMSRTFITPRISGMRHKASGVSVTDERPRSSPIPVATASSDTHPGPHVPRADASGSQEHQSVLAPAGLGLPKHTLAAGTASDILCVPVSDRLQQAGSCPLSVSAGQANSQHSNMTCRDLTLIRKGSWENILQAELGGDLRGAGRAGVHRERSFGLGTQLGAGRLTQVKVSQLEVDPAHSAGGSVDSGRETIGRGLSDQPQSNTGAGGDTLVISLLDSLTLRFVHRTNSGRNSAAAAPVGAGAGGVDGDGGGATADGSSVAFPGWGAVAGANAGAITSRANSFTLLASSDRKSVNTRNWNWANNPLALIPSANSGPGAVAEQCMSADAAGPVTPVNVANPQGFFARGLGLGSNMQFRHEIGASTGTIAPGHTVCNSPRALRQENLAEQQPALQLLEMDEEATAIASSTATGPYRPNFGSPMPLGEGLEEHADVSWVPTNQDEDDLPCSVVLVPQEAVAQSSPGASVPPPSTHHTMHRKGSFGSSTPLVTSRFGPRPGTPFGMVQAQFSDTLPPADVPTAASAAAGSAAANASESGLDGPRGSSVSGSANTGSGVDLQLRQLLSPSSVIVDGAVTPELLALLMGGGNATSTTGNDLVDTAAAAGRGRTRKHASELTTSAGTTKGWAAGSPSGNAGPALFPRHEAYHQTTQVSQLPCGISHAIGEEPVLRGLADARFQPCPIVNGCDARHPQVMGPGEELGLGDHRSRAHTFDFFHHNHQQPPESRLGPSKTSMGLLGSSASLQVGRVAANRPGLVRTRTQALEMIPLPAKVPEVRQTWRQLCALNWPLLATPPRLAGAGTGVGPGPGAAPPRKFSGSLDLSRAHSHNCAALQPHPEADGDKEHEDVVNHQNHHRHPHGNKTVKGAVLLFRGCRVRMGLHTGIPLTTDVTFNHTAGLMAYSGMPLKIAKAVGDSAAGGSVLLSNTTFNLLHPHLSDLPGHPEAHYCGDTQIELIIRSLYMLVARDQHPRLGYLAPLRNLRFLQTGNLDAPVGTVAICFMMLFGATKAVAELGQPAVNALQQFKSLVTRECCDCGGFVVEATDGLCLAAFMEPAAAAIWALRCQTNLCAHNWSPEVLASPYFREVREYQRIQRGRGQPGRRVTNVICRGPRIRTGISVGSVTAEVSSATARLSYRGKVMNRSARVASQATDNQLLLSEAAWQRIVATAGICALLSDGAPASLHGCADGQQGPGYGKGLAAVPGQCSPAARKIPLPECGPEVSLRSGVGYSQGLGSSFCSSELTTPCHSPLLSTSTAAGAHSFFPSSTEGTNQLLAAANQLLSETASEGDSEDVEQLVSSAMAVGKMLPSLPQGYVLTGRSAGRFTLKGVSEPQELFEVRMDLLVKSATTGLAPAPAPAATTGLEPGSREATMGAEAGPRAAMAVASLQESRMRSFTQHPQWKSLTAGSQGPQFQSFSFGGHSSTSSGAVGMGKRYLPVGAPVGSNPQQYSGTLGEINHPPLMKSADTSPLGTQEPGPGTPAAADVPRVAAIRGPVEGLAAALGAPSKAQSSLAFCLDSQAELTRCPKRVEPKPAGAAAAAFGDLTGACPSPLTYSPTCSVGLKPSAEKLPQQQKGGSELRRVPERGAGGGGAVNGPGAKVLAGDALLEVLASAVLGENSSGIGGLEQANEHDHV
ncbi:hypothetical protein Vretimale_11650 [Volvox reticuliferus]|uniref:Guanylate cyclase domain-containing protein n=1 Tax=Volvox reticuliferus TaxID=1737510 RepID=A0A8J4CW06_9CHLO|nr:hypothetical protein Vretifemale_14759 [Volvox reticuliferus]GIM07560.1 hypothetical protein Vretimale_11650 [Volvox reticuliferus]